MKLPVVILERDFTIEYDFEITSPSHPGVSPSLNHSGDPPEPAEYELTVSGLFCGKDPITDIPEWLSTLILDFLYESDKVSEQVHEAEFEDYEFRGVS